MIGASGQAGAQPIFNWSGVYIGAYAGGAWGNSNVNTLVDCANAPSLWYICNSTGSGAVDAAAIGAAGTGKINSSGFTGGFEGGYNWQNRNIVYGFETDFGAFKLSGSRQGSGVLQGGGSGNGGTPFTVAISESTDWLWTVRGRVGMALPNNFLPFVTGGLAVTRLSLASMYSDTFPASSYASNSSVLTGWTLGGGFEWAVNNHWRVKAEYLYLNFGGNVGAAGTIIAPGNPAYSQGISTTADLKAQVLRVGANYGF
jgi:outer membrane immunogenic protein